MTVSKPSREVYVVDIPEVANFSANFHYNFFVPDESVNDSGGVPEQILLKPSSEVDSEYVQYATTRAPRFVVFGFTPVRLSDVGRQVTDLDQRNNVFKDQTIEDGMISNNLDKIVTEDQFASFDFISVQFHDGEIDNKIYYLVSGSFEQHTINDDGNSNLGYNKSATKLSSLLPDHISNSFLTKGFTQLGKSSGVQYQSDFKNVRNLTAASSPDRYARLRSFQVSAQINGKLFQDIVHRTINDPNSPYGDDLHSLYLYSKQVTATSKQRFSLTISENDYKTFVPFVNLQVQSTAHQTDRRQAEIVGYIIDKIEITKDGQTQVQQPIVIEKSNVSSTADFRIKYDSTYAYTIRSIARFTIPAIDDETGEIATIQILVSSKPSTKVYVKTSESVPPPPPTDLNFTWDYENDKLQVHWVFPTNSQRDIKKFQLFRRRSTEHPFELLKMYDFDDSVVKFDDNETPDPALIERLTSPSTSYVDDDFMKRSRFIYAVASIDAHGMTSNYSAQFELSFDIFKNKLVKRLVSHTGAPKPYPNLYLETDTFVDTIRVNGPHSKRLKVYFNPEYYQLYDENQRLVKILSTKQTGGKYQLLVTNVDNHKSQTLSIKIDDRIQAANRKIVFPNQTFGKSKKESAR